MRRKGITLTKKFYIILLLNYFKLLNEIIISVLLLVAESDDFSHMPVVRTLIVHSHETYCLTSIPNDYFC